MLAHMFCFTVCPEINIRCFFYKLFLISVKIYVRHYYMYSTNYAMTSRMLYYWGKSCSGGYNVADKETDVGKI